MQVIERTKDVYRKGKFICLDNEMKGIYAHKRVERTYRWQVTQQRESGTDIEMQPRISYFGRRMAKDGSTFGNVGFITTSYTLRNSPSYKLVEVA